MNYNHKTVFNLSSKIIFPKFLTRNFGSQKLVFFYEQPNWISISQSEHIILNDLANKTIEQTMLNHSENEVINILRKLLERNILPLKNNKKNKSNLLPMHLYLTNACNLKCKHCYMFSSSPLKDELNKREWLNVIDQFVDYGGKNISISGGEPLLVPYFEDLIWDIRKKSKHLRIKLLTNGILLNKFIYILNDLYIEEIQISLDGPDAKTHDLIRGKGSFEKTINNIKLLKDYKGNILISMCVLNEYIKNYENSFKKFYQYLIQIIPKAKISLATDLMNGRHYKKLNYIKASENLNRIRSLFRSTANEVGIEIEEDTRFERNAKVVSCGYGGTLTIQSNGDVFPCGYVIGQQPIGNVRYQSISNLLKMCTKILYEHMVNNLHPCNKCVLSYVCGGACRIENYINNKNFKKSSCSDKAKKDIWKSLLDNDQKKFLEP